MQDAASTSPLIRPWWREAEFYCVLLVGLGIYATRLTTLTIRGEESRRARVAQEMLDTGDWIVERQQGEIFADRPPLGEWAIAIATLLNGGQMTTATVRAPAVLATILTGLILYVLSRRFLSRSGAFGTALAYLTFGQVLQIGRFAESEGIFVLLLGAAMLVWLTGYVERWRPWLMWSSSYALAALAGLTKGPQGPIYFCAAIGLYLLLQRDWRQLFSWSHALGLSVFAAIFLSWLIPYYLRTDFTAARASLFATSLMHINSTDPLGPHLLTYPWQILGCLLPWSPLLVRYFDKSFWAGLGKSRPYVVFGLTAIVATFPSVWFARGALNRHYMGLYPIMAVLAGIVIDRCLSSAADSLLRRRWNWYVVGMACVMLVAVAVVCSAPLWPAKFAKEATQPLLFSILFATVGGSMAALMIWSTRSSRLLAGRIGLCAAAVFLGLSYTGLIINSHARCSLDNGAEVAQVKAVIPENTQLVSFGPLDHVFTFHYRDAIPVVAWPKDNDSWPVDSDYFCFTPNDQTPRELPFPWEKVAVVSCDRNQQEEAQRVVIVGRRIDPDHAAVASRGKTIRR